MTGTPTANPYINQLRHAAQEKRTTAEVDAAAAHELDEACMRAAHEGQIPIAQIAREVSVPGYLQRSQIYEAIARAEKLQTNVSNL